MKIVKIWSPKLIAFILFPTNLWHNKKLMSKLFSKYCPSRNVYIVHSCNLFEVLVAWLWKYLVHVETIISPVLLVCLFSQVPFPSPGFPFFPADKVDEHVGEAGVGGCKSNSSWSAHGELEGLLEGLSECRQQACRDSWVEVGSLDKPQSPPLCDCMPCFSDTRNDRALYTQSFPLVWCRLVAGEGGREGDRWVREGGVGGERVGGERLGADIQSGIEKYCVFFVFGSFKI